MADASQRCAEYRVRAKTHIMEDTDFLTEKSTSYIHGDIKNERKISEILKTLCVTCKKLQENCVAHNECLALKVCIAVTDSTCAVSTAVQMSRRT